MKLIRPPKNRKTFGPTTTANQEVISKTAPPRRGPLNRAMIATGGRIENNERMTREIPGLTENEAVAITGKTAMETAAILDRTGDVTTKMVGINATTMANKSHTADETTTVAKVIGNRTAANEDRTENKTATTDRSENETATTGMPVAGTITKATEEAALAGTIGIRIATGTAETGNPMDDERTPGIWSPETTIAPRGTTRGAAIRRRETKIGGSRNTTEGIAEATILAANRSLIEAIEMTGIREGAEVLDRATIVSETRNGAPAIPASSNYHDISCVKEVPPSQNKCRVAEFLQKLSLVQNSCTSSLLCRISPQLSLVQNFSTSSL